MNYQEYHPFLTDLNLSIIIPLNSDLLISFKKLIEDNHNVFARNGLDIIAICDKNMDEYQVKVVSACFPLINWVILSCDTVLDNSKSLSCMFNSALKISGKKFVMIWNPERSVNCDLSFRFRYLMEYYSPVFVTADRDILPRKVGETVLKELFFFMVEKEQCNSVGGFPEKFSTTREECLYLFAKLEYKGLKNLKIIEPALNNTCEYSDPLVSHHNTTAPIIRNRRNDFLPLDKKTHNTSYVYDYRSENWGKPELLTYLQMFKQHTIYKKEILSHRFPIVALVQTYNEETNIRPLLDNLKDVCDGIIILDDCSTDRTYELAHGSNLLLKVQKNREEFDDLQNRNALLNLLSFIKCEWAFFIDADERFDLRFCNLREEVTQNLNKVIGFWLINTWDSPDRYRKDISDTASHSKSGILSRARMFHNNNGRVQIVLRNKRKLHFPPNPYNQEPQPGRILLIHSGLQDKDNRIEKLNFYRNQDNFEERDDEAFYDYLIGNNVQLATVKDLTL